MKRMATVFLTSILILGMAQPVIAAETLEETGIEQEALEESSTDPLPQEDNMLLIEPGSSLDEIQSETEGAAENIIISEQGVNNELEENVRTDSYTDEEALEVNVEEETDLLQADTDCYTVTVSGTHDYGMAKEMLPFINEERQRRGLNTLTLDKELTDAAMQRAAEIAIHFSHTRPDDSDFRTINKKVGLENILHGSRTAENAYYSFEESPGHYANMMNWETESIGLGHFRYYNMDYWVQVFSVLPSEQTETRTGIVEATRKVSVNKNREWSFEPVYDEENTAELFVGEQLQLTTAESEATWKSSDPSIASIDSDGVVTGKKPGTVDIYMTNGWGLEEIVGSITVVARTVPKKTYVPSVSYRTHIQGIGWQDWKKDGDMSGTSGQSKRLEAINIKLSDIPYDGAICYRVHVQTYGWQRVVNNGEMAGTSGEGKRLEAIQIYLTGEMADYYDVYYQTHIQNYGWSGWATNGEMCGSQGYAYRLEGIRIKLAKKGEAAPGNTANPFYARPGTSSPTSKMYGALVGYNTHVQTYGWQNFVYDGAMSGTSGESKRLEGIQINLVDKPYSGDIVYRTHVQTYGWQAWKKQGQMSGTSGESKRLEGIQIYLTGEMAKHFDVYYRVHAQTYGWLGWAKNGVMAGTSGLSKRLEGINIVLVPKGGAAPGTTANPYVVGNGGSLPDNPYKG